VQPDPAPVLGAPTTEVAVDVGVGRRASASRNCRTASPGTVAGTPREPAVTRCPDARAALISWIWSSSTVCVVGAKWCAFMVFSVCRWAADLATVRRPECAGLGAAARATGPGELPRRSFDARPGDRPTVDTRVPLRRVARRSSGLISTHTRLSRTAASISGRRPNRTRAHAELRTLLTVPIAPEPRRSIRLPLGAVRLE
jgi:hypothetical protein